MDEKTRTLADRILGALDKDPEVKQAVADALAKGTPRLVVCQDWEESERGWGVRPDGFTLHLTMDNRDAYVNGYCRTFHTEAQAPDEYTRVSGDPRLVEADDETYAKLTEHADMQHDYEWRKFGMWGKGKVGPKEYRP